jgi:2-aminoadipate transaminase
MSASVSARIDEIQRQAAQASDLIPLAGGLPDARFFPKRHLGDAFHSALTRPRQALQYGWPEGEPELRDWVAARLRTRGADLGPEHVVITNGAQQAISLSAEVLFAEGNTVGLQAESYPGAIDILRALGLRFVSWRMPAHGYYLMPAMANPRGTAMSDDQRAQILERAGREGTPLIEDDAYAELTFDGQTARPLVADAPESVVHIGTMSKVLCPGLRVGWLATRHPELKSIVAKKQQLDLQAGSLTQRILIEYLKGDHYEGHLTRIRRAYARKAKLLRNAVLRNLPGFSVGEPRGGFSLWLEHKEPRFAAFDVPFLAAAIEAGVSFDPGSSFRINGNGRLSLRLCHSGVREEDIEPGVERLARAFQQVSLKLSAA